jgi:hypothetical protein
MDKQIENESLSEEVMPDAQSAASMTAKNRRRRERPGWVSARPMNSLTSTTRPV